MHKTRKTVEDLPGFVRQKDYSHSFFGVLLWLIYVLNSIQNGNIEPVFLPIISFIKTFVAEKVAKLPVEWYRVAVGLSTLPGKYTCVNPNLIYQVVLV